MEKTISVRGTVSGLFRTREGKINGMVPHFPNVRPGADMWNIKWGPRIQMIQGEQGNADWCLRFTYRPEKFREPIILTAITPRAASFGLSNRGDRKFPIGQVPVHRMPASAGLVI